MLNNLKIQCAHCIFMYIPFKIIVKILMNNKGGDFIVKKTDYNTVFVPEEWNEEQRMIEQMCYDFMKAELFPILDKIDSMSDPELMPTLMQKAGELGLLGLSVPEEYGGLGVDFKTSMLATEALGAGHSFSVAYGAHTGIGTLPLLYYGNDAQKQKYIPKCPKTFGEPSGNLRETF